MLIVVDLVNRLKLEPLHLRHQLMNPTLQLRLFLLPSLNLIFILKLELLHVICLGLEIFFDLVFGLNERLVFLVNLAEPVLVV